VLFTSPADYNITACGSKVYYWNTTNVFGMGSNYGGSLGTGSFGSTDTRCVGALPILSFQNAHEQLVGLTCNSATMLAWTKSGKVYGWGSNMNKQLGPLVVSLANPTQLPMPISNISKVFIGQTHAMALSSDGQLVCWGSNRWRECGTLLADSIWPPVQLSVGASPIVDIALGAMHSIILTADGNVYGFGFNHYGQVCRTSLALYAQTPPFVSTSPIVGQAFYGRPIRKIAATVDGSFFLTDEGRLFGCGKHSAMGWSMYSPYVDRPREITVLPPDDLGSNTALRDIFASNTAYHTLAVTRDLELVGTGSNTAQELALGNNTLFSATFVPLLVGNSLAPVVAGSIAGYQSIVSTETSVVRPTPTILPPQCQVQGCSCPIPLNDAICVGGKWTAPNAIIWVHTTINVTIELIGNLTLAPGGSLSMPIGGSALQVKGCTQFFGGYINFTASPDQLLQLSATPLLFINTTCGAGTPTVIITVNGAQDPCSTVTVNSVQQGPSGYYILFDRSSCKKPVKLWIVGAVIGGIAALVVVLLLLAFLVRPIRLIIFPFYQRRLNNASDAESLSLTEHQSHNWQVGHAGPSEVKDAFLRV